MLLFIIGYGFGLIMGICIMCVFITQRDKENH
jgi:hypothetical protein